MKLNKNNKVKKMLNMFMFLIAGLIAISSVSSADFIYDQSDVLLEYNTQNKGNAFLFDLVGLTSTQPNPPAIGNVTGDLKIDIPILKEDMFFYMNNHVIDNRINVTIFFSRADGFSNISNAYTQELFMAETGTYYFKIQADDVAERGSILIEVPDTYTQTVYFQSQEAKTVSFVTGTLITAIKDLIDINIGFWKIIYYLFIFMIVLTGIGMLVGFGFKVFSWAETFSEKKKKVLYMNDKRD